MSTAAAPAVNLGLVELRCGTCGFLLPPFARSEVLSKESLRTEKAICPTCGSEYRICLQRTKETDLRPDRLNEIRNKNR